jgi:hypothetical protein
METVETATDAAIEDAVAATMNSALTSTETIAPVRPPPPDSQCPHILDLWKDEELKAKVIRKYKSIVVWAFDRYRDHEPVKKKRKVE